ncbi:class I SAM-dependent methyltransferase [Gemmata sp. JC673]|uniref:Class I SAM-dependent methyltransferase n=1 Tax=Gemmata algarum TaxID=2975278 RepID=A0ABU5EX77_9BACT|nr:class I SAM-dependent methyltransferase [Gemmata algarum]MDY3559067.1 class I SAM-dependent methyltransferase [Gemmata algarum]
MTDHQRFAALTFDGFRALAATDGLSRYERIGFPDSYRAGHEANIYRDVRRKLTNLDLRDQRVLDIGPGCSDLPHLLLETCRQQGHELLLCDSPEMLAHIPDDPRVRKFPGRFPQDGDLAAHAGRVDVVLVYSVLQYVFVEASVFDFLDACLALLAPGGQLLIGDVPNVSKRKRFFASDAGVRCHRAFTGTDETPEVRFNAPDRGKIDDAAVLALVARARAAGFDAYVVPQAAELPMANRREDILIVRP